MFLNRLALALKAHAPPPRRPPQVTGVKIISGVDEGAFAWLTLNYLKGNLGKEEHQTVAAIDLGEYLCGWRRGGADS
jgi:Golgi nucleoside diphosphatase